jgi:hypothetical protein
MTATFYTCLRVPRDVVKRRAEQLAANGIAVHTEWGDAETTFAQDAESAIEAEAALIRAFGGAYERVGQTVQGEPR